MNNTQILKKAIKNNDILEINSILNSQNLDYAVRLTSEFGYLDVLKRILKKDNIDPSKNSNYALRHASKNGHFEIVELLLNDARVDPSERYNSAIRGAFKHNHTKTIDLLWKIDIVRLTLKENSLTLYNDIVNLNTQKKLANFNLQS